MYIPSSPPCHWQKKKKESWEVVFEMNLDGVEDGALNLFSLHPHISLICSVIKVPHLHWCRGIMRLPRRKYMAAIEKT